MRRRKTRESALRTASQIISRTKNRRLKKSSTLQTPTSSCIISVSTTMAAQIPCRKPPACVKNIKLPFFCTKAKLQARNCCPSRINTTYCIINSKSNASAKQMTLIQSTNSIINPISSSNPSDTPSPIRSRPNQDFLGNIIRRVQTKEILSPAADYLVHNNQPPASKLQLSTPQILLRSLNPEKSLPNSFPFLPNLSTYLRKHDSFPGQNVHTACFKSLPFSLSNQIRVRKNSIPSVTSSNPKLSFQKKPVHQSWRLNEIQPVSNHGQKEKKRFDSKPLGRSGLSFLCDEKELNKLSLHLTTLFDGKKTQANLGNEITALTTYTREQMTDTSREQTLGILFNKQKPFLF